MVQIRVQSQSDVGMKRKQNEDSLFTDKGLMLFVVADGMGGHNAGEVASSEAVSSIQNTMTDNRNMLTAANGQNKLHYQRSLIELLEKAVQGANGRIYDLSRDDASRKKMGTTVSTLLLSQNHGFIAHVGDSRIYLFRKGNLHLLTEDHSLVNQYLKQGKLTLDEVKASPYKNVLTRAVGVQPWVEIDLIDFELEEGDKFLLASDGMTGYIEDEELAEIMGSIDFELLTGHLIDLSNERGGRDNITVIVVEVESLTADTVPITSATIKINSLQAIPLFQKLSYQQLSQIATLLSEESFKPGEQIIREGEPGDKFYICLSGRVTVEKGKSVISELKAGDYFGEMALVDNSPRSAHVFSREETHVLVMSRKNLIDLIRRTPQIAMRFLWSFTQVLTSRLRLTSLELSSKLEEPTVLTDIFDETQ